MAIVSPVPVESYFVYSGGPTMGDFWEDPRPRLTTYTSMRVVLLNPTHEVFVPRILMVAQDKNMARCTPYPLRSRFLPTLPHCKHFYIETVPRYFSI
ncbi:hypothetical protein E2C01_022996 [Portunus trituberculatus]|uniref:Uncharacterized protein n=1 Tax=Portunus trituberculatus TaxID=210409 RepID=A0A5B7E8R4_PORTR|nr:hypothetical protein [Portunus trituberculatus]